MATIKKTGKKMQMGGGIKPMMKKGGSFPDLNKDGKITKADILKGRGVIAKKGMKVSKAQKGITASKVNEGIRRDNDSAIATYRRGDMKKNMEYRGKVQEGFKKLKTLENTTPKNKMGGKTKKCAYGCK